ncbi:MAG: HAMP domain-containing protein [Anaerolineales bacterium]|nr:HAMP domain-containing protein [Anaerolineales bacterium]
MISTTLQRLNNRGLIAPTSDEVQRTVNRLSENFNVRILVIGKDGKVIADNRPGAGVGSFDAFSIEDLQERSIRGSFVDELDRTWLWVGTPLDQGRVLVVASLKPGLLSLRDVAGDLLSPVLQAAAIGLIISVILAIIISRWVAAPLQRMSKAAEGVSEGEYRGTIQPEGPSEVQSLVTSFNDMVMQVQSGQQIQREFLANVSHELKTPLTSIQGFAQAILDGAASEGEAQERAAQVIYEESDRLRRLVEDLLDLARIDAGQVAFDRRPVDLNALLTGIADKQTLSATEKGVRLEFRLPDLPTIIGDGDRLAQVFTNLVDNAIKHTPESGVIVMSGEEDSGWVSIHVTDTGPGIPSEDLSRIFERFYQVDKARKGGSGRGVGLGLAISKQIVEVHGGRMVAQSVLGKGSRFTVQLPIVKSDDVTLVRPTEEPSV